MSSYPVLFITAVAWLLPTTTVWSQEDDTFSMAVCGESIISRKLSVYEEKPFLDMIELIRSADVAFTNLEMLLHDYEPYPMHASGGSHQRADPIIAKELVWAGFDMVSRANNHTGDYGVHGMRLTTKYVAEAGLVQAGVGESLTEAREARFIETARGRVALISCASSFLDFSRASKTRGDMPARPGLSPLRFSTTYVVTREKLEALRQILKDIGRGAPETGDELMFFSRHFVVGDEPAVLTKPHQGDLEEIRAVVRNAERLADYVFVTIHAHNLGEYLETFAHAMIDAGADLFVGHGPHEMHGIEIYKGTPIFYSMGSFITQYETQLRFPADDYERHPELDLNSGVADYYDVRLETLAKQRGFHLPDEQWEGAIAIPKWKSGDLREIELHPITLGAGLPRWIRGRPMLADTELSKKVITDLQRLSEPYGTTIEFRDGIGIITLDTTATDSSKDTHR